jgi:predicted small secreted protein
MKRLVFLMLLSLFSLGTVTSLTACNTMAGVGEDVQEAGEAVEDEAEGHLDCDTSDEC